MCAECHIDIVVRFLSAVLYSNIMKPHLRELSELLKRDEALDGMSVSFKIPERGCLERGAEIRNRTLVDHLARIRDPAGEIGYI
jgi:hypothetical protein